MNLPTRAELTISFPGPPSKHPADLERAQTLLQEHGCFIARGLLSAKEVALIQDELSRLIDLRYRARGEQRPAGGRFDAGIMDLVAKDRAEGSFIYNACRQLLSVHALDVKSELVELSKALIRTDFICASNVKMMRMDLPHEEKFLYPWHQDFPYVQDSEDALVYWFTIHDLVGNNGGLVCALGSHRDGVHPVVVPDADNQSKNRAHSISLADPALPDRFPQFHLSEFEVGELLVFSTLLLHRSIENTSAHPRWSVQLRHGNFANERIVKKGWPGGNSLTASFVKTHPEYVRS
jgi:ectoine hydroxylase-related dioxygenase (phytanoyl-CoA dioxygenase family)